MQASSASVDPFSECSEMISSGAPGINERWIFTVRELTILQLCVQKVQSDIEIWKFNIYNVNITIAT